MQRILCLHLPNWPIQRLLAADPALDAARPLILHARDRRRAEVVQACNAPAARRGVRPGMPLAEAAALSGADGCLAPADPASDLAALARLAEHCEQYSPLVGWETTADSPAQPDRLLLEITGSSLHWGGEDALARAALSDLDRLGYAAVAAIAGSVGRAWAQAVFGQPLPVAALRAPAETVALLAQLGVVQIEQLLQLPRASLPARFGQQLVLRLDQFLGSAPETIVPHRPPPRFVVERLLEHPLDNRELLEHVLHELVQRLCAELAQQDEGAVRLACRLDCACQGPSGPPGGKECLPRRAVAWEVGLFRPWAQPAHLWDLIRMPLDRAALPGPVERVTLAAPLTARLEHCQQELFADAPRQVRRQAELLIDRLSSRLGAQGVLRAKLAADPLPERAVEYAPAIEAENRSLGFPSRAVRRPPGSGGRPRAQSQPAVPSGKGGRLPRLRSPLERPLLLHSPPLALEVVSIVPDGPPVSFQFRGRSQRVARWWGPERIESGWQRGRSVRRDYYRVETDEGARYWLFRRLQDGRWHVHGEFA